MSGMKEGRAQAARNKYSGLPALVVFDTEGQKAAGIGLYGVVRPGKNSCWPSMGTRT